MKTATTLSLSLLAALSAQVSLASTAPPAQASYYGVARLISVEHEARNMASSARPGIGAFVAGDDTARDLKGSLALGYQLGNGWRLEGEFVLPQKDKFTSGSSSFPASMNVHQVESRRAMFNAYRDFRVTDNLSLYGSAGVGLAQLTSSGWQGNESRRYASQKQTNLAWSLGAGVVYDVNERFALDLGYRYVDLGNTESGWNSFTNGRRLQDEKMKANVVSNEFVLGARLVF